ncbi:MAG: HIT family protein [Betaproteobacteria bacterium]|nr:HIT family protein [Betaproteobacteria bacterium]
MTKLTETECELCNSAGGFLLWQDGFCRIVEVAEPDYPGFCRVILERHVKEMSDLDSAERVRLLHAVNETEAALRAVMRPDKVNLASLGNATPHLHWHVIPRFRDDRHFPKPVWAAPERQSGKPKHAGIAALRADLAAELKRRLKGS